MRGRGGGELKGVRGYYDGCAIVYRGQRWGDVVISSVRGLQTGSTGARLLIARWTVNVVASKGTRGVGFGRG